MPRLLARWSTNQEFKIWPKLPNFRGWFGGGLLSLEAQINYLTAAVDGLTAAILKAYGPREEVVAIEVITPTHADYAKELKQFKPPRKIRKDKGGKNPNYPAVTYSRCCGAEGRKKSKFDGRCFECR